MPLFGENITTVSGSGGIGGTNVSFGGNVYNKEHLFPFLHIRMSQADLENSHYLVVCLASPRSRRGPLRSLGS